MGCVKGERVLLVLSDIYYIVIELPGNVRQAVKNFFGSALRKW
jgi:hypothetical protein